MPKEDVDQFYAAYCIQFPKNMHSRGLFDKNLAKFFEITLPAYVYGEGDRNVAWREWLKFIGSPDQAIAYFCAVDSVHSYTRKNNMMAKIYAVRVSIEIHDDSDDCEMEETEFNSTVDFKYESDAVDRAMEAVAILEEDRYRSGQPITKEGG
jgi:hypothetical protein